MDLGQNTLVIVLAVTTIGIFIVFGLYQRFRATEAKRDNETSAIMDNPKMTHKEPRTPTGAKDREGKLVR